MRLRAEIIVYKISAVNAQKVLKQQEIDGVAKEQLNELEACFESCGKIHQNMDDIIEFQNGATETYRDLNKGNEWHYLVKIQEALFQSRVGNEYLRIPGVEMVSDVWNIRRVMSLA